MYYLQQTQQLTVVMYKDEPKRPGFIIEVARFNNIEDAVAYSGDQNAKAQAAPVEAIMTDVKL